MKYLFSLILIGMNCITNTMEYSSGNESETTEEVNSLESQTITDLYKKLHKLQKNRTEQQTTIKTQIQQTLEELEVLKLKNEELSEKINNKTSAAYIDQKVDQIIKIYSHPKMIAFFNKDSESSNINRFSFNRNNLFLMLGLTSISFIVGYMIGNKSLLLNHLLWGKKI